MNAGVKGEGSMMKKQYTAVAVSVTEFQEQDILTVSSVERGVGTILEWGSGTDLTKH